MSETLEALRFRAMGCDVELFGVRASSELLHQAHSEIDVLEKRWSRFIPESEISQLNANAGVPVLVSESTFELIRLAMQGWRSTGGLFDPTMLHALKQAGYDRSYSELSEQSSMPVAEPHPNQPTPHDPAGVVLDHALRAVTLPLGTAFDPGGIGKGLAADVISAWMLEHGAAGACVNIGGDLRARGDTPGDDGWVIGIEHPLTNQVVATIGLREGAVATSSTGRRTWVKGGRDHHHLLDPSTCEPARSGITSATVIAGDGWEAEVLAKAVLLAGIDAGMALADRHDVDALVFADDGTSHRTARFSRFEA